MQHAGQRTRWDERLALGALALALVAAVALWAPAAAEAGDVAVAGTSGNDTFVFEERAYAQTR